MLIIMLKILLAFLIRDRDYDMQIVKVNFNGAVLSGDRYLFRVKYGKV